MSLILQTEKCGFMFYFCFSRETKGNDSLLQNQDPTDWGVAVGLELLHKKI